MRQCLGYVFARAGITEVPEYLQEDLAQSISEVRIQNKDMVRAMENYERLMSDMQRG